MTLPRAQDWLFSAKTFGAAILALGIGFWLDLPRPYWAMATAYIASQPLSGATRSKAAFRAGGTILGGLAALVLVPNLVNAPVLLSLALAAWTGICLFGALLDRTPRSYVFMLAGYTAAIIGFPSVSDPGTIFDTVLARTEEILLGIACASLVQTLVFPRSVGPVLAERTTAWLRDADEWAAFALAGRPGTSGAAPPRRRLAAGVVEIDGLSASLAWDAFIQRDIVQAMRQLRQDMLMLVPVLSSVADRVAALSAVGAAPNALLDRLKAWVADGALSAGAPPLHRAIADLERNAASGTDWPGLLTISLGVRLREFVVLRAACGALQAVLSGSDRRSEAPLLTTPVPNIGEARHRDPGMALLSAGAAMAAVLLCCAFWIAAAWPEGAVGAEMAAVVCSFFAQQDDPVPAILSFLRWSMVAVLVDAVYLFALLPQATGFEMLVLALAPPFLIYGALAAQPRTASVGMALAANGATLLSLQSTYSADFAAFANSGLALIVGMGLGAIVTGLVRSVGAEWSVRRLVRANWADLAAAAARYGRGDRNRFAALMLDRLGLMAPRAAAVAPGSDLHKVDTVAELRVGLNLVELRRGRHGLPADARNLLERALDAMATYFTARARAGAALPPADAMLSHLDAALAAVAATPPGDARRDALLGLVGVRRGLFPDRPPPHLSQPVLPSPMPPALIRHAT